jgi:hypothetical protein
MRIQEHTQHAFWNYCSALEPDEYYLITNGLQIETDPDLAVIRQEQDYRALIDHLKEREKKSK